MEATKIIVKALIHAEKEKVWNAYTNPEHITRWNFADPSWHCPTAANDMRIGGVYSARMEARDGSFGFDFEAIYTEILPGERFTYAFGGRFATVVFQESPEGTMVTITFDPENENPIAMQEEGWQSILNNFKNYTENTASF
jgi:uncharacterized protein YndB with AHSA1/START domain